MILNQKIERYIDSNYTCKMSNTMMPDVLPAMTLVMKMNLHEIAAKLAHIEHNNNQGVFHCFMEHVFNNMSCILCKHEATLRGICISYTSIVYSVCKPCASKTADIERCILPPKIKTHGKTVEYCRVS
jgi:hypothetical protein